MTGRRQPLRWLACATLVTGLAWLGLRVTLWTPPGFTRSVHATLGERASTVSTAANVDLTFMPVPHGPRRFFSARWRGVWHVAREDTYQLFLGADDWARLAIDGVAIAERGRGRGFGTVAVPHRLAAGLHTIDLEYEQEGGGAFLTAGWGAAGSGRRDWTTAEVFPQPVSRSARITNTVTRWIGWLAVIGAAGVVVVGLARGVALARRAAAADPRRWRGLAALTLAALARRERWLSAAGLIVVLGLAGALRLDAIMVRYGPFDRPVWLAETEIHTRERIERLLRPDSFSWAKVAVPYVGGDPINYLRFGREMRSFYAAHVREPVFPAAVRIWLGLLDDHDVGVSFASATFSLLAVAATWWLGRMTFGAWVGLLAALALAMDKDAITWAADGWRDDAVLFFAILVAIGAMGLAWRPGWPWAIVLGLSAAGALLTRVTALSFVVPALVAVAWFGRGTGVARLRATAVAAVVAVALAAPYYYNCWRTFGDPLYPINVHTSFYRARSGEAHQEQMSAGTYLLGRMRREPIGTLRTGVIGLFWFPFENKWVGFDYWYVGLRRFLMGMSAIGLVLFVTTGRGLLLWVMILAVLFPYAFTWSIQGGGEWRFTLPVYPFYLVAAALALVTTVQRLPAFAARLRRMVDGGPGPAGAAGR